MNAAQLYCSSCSLGRFKSARLELFVVSLAFFFSPPHQIRSKETRERSLSLSHCTTDNGNNTHTQKIKINGKRKRKKNCMPVKSNEQKCWTTKSTFIVAHTPPNCSFFLCHEHNSNLAIYSMERSICAANSFASQTNFDSFFFCYSHCSNCFPSICYIT